jgi:hypothetical protein
MPFALMSKTANIWQTGASGSREHGKEKERERERERVRESGISLIYSCHSMPDTLNICPSNNCVHHCKCSSILQMRTESYITSHAPKQVTVKGWSQNLNPSLSDSKEGGRGTEFSTLLLHGSLKIHFKIYQLSQQNEPARIWCIG